MEKKDFPTDDEIFVIDGKSDDYCEGFTDCLRETLALMQQNRHVPVSRFITTFLYAIELIEKENKRRRE